MTKVMLFFGRFQKKMLCFCRFCEEFSEKWKSGQRKRLIL